MHLLIYKSCAWDLRAGSDVIDQKPWQKKIFSEEHRKREQRVKKGLVWEFS